MMNFLRKITRNNQIRPFFHKQSTQFYSEQKKATNNQEFDDFLPESIKYEIPKYKKNPKDIDFPLLINGAPKLSIKVSNPIYKKRQDL
jgi:hypothetical protein